MKSNRGFTLLELLTVIGIIAMIAGFLFPTIGKVKHQARVSRAKAMIETVAMALHAYRTDWGVYGPTENELNDDGTLYAMLTTGKKNGPYLELKGKDITTVGSVKKITDPWNGIYEVFVDTDGGSNAVPANNSYSFDISTTTPAGDEINNWD
ncbi:prepilin-type N-terminal cleavage/methylation domain-containing protein [bacterium]|nr:prepilin-type N-terminal cleavage/methylation domain-containing protein [bacterium]MCP5461584.1 prepilin-type N-terminal cleavage/methylation domain-containing protein [bacterium]